MWGLYGVRADVEKDVFPVVALYGKYHEIISVRIWCYVNKIISWPHWWMRINHKEQVRLMESLRYITKLWRYFCLDVAALPSTG